MGLYWIWVDNFWSEILSSIVKLEIQIYNLETHQWSSLSMNSFSLTSNFFFQYYDYWLMIRGKRISKIVAEKFLTKQPSNIQKLGRVFWISFSLRSLSLSLQLFLVFLLLLILSFPLQSMDNVRGVAGISNLLVRF